MPRLLILRFHSTQDQSCNLLKNRYPEMKKKQGTARRQRPSWKMIRKVRSGPEAPSISVTPWCSITTATAIGKRRASMAFDCRIVQSFCMIYT